MSWIVKKDPESESMMKVFNKHEVGPVTYLACTLNLDDGSCRFIDDLESYSPDQLYNLAVLAEGLSKEYNKEQENENK